MDEGKLTLRCAVLNHDKLEIERGEEGLDGAEWTIYCTEGAERAGVLLSRETLRELFNWIGVELHK